MNFTFGIITNGSELIKKSINSIHSLNISDYEIIVVGQSNYIDNNIKYIPYIDKSIEGDISIKKNIITQNAKYDNIVYIHDYIYFDIDWYNGFLIFNNNFDFNICMTPILNLDGTRYRDWCLWADDAIKYVSVNNYLIPYDMTHLTKMMYISGAYWVAKKDFMMDNPLNEKLVWGQGEDVEWSLKVRNKTIFSMNKHSFVHLSKYKDKIFNEITTKEILLLNNLSNYNNDLAYNNLISNHLHKWIS